MRTENTLFAIAFLAVGLFLIAVSIPVTYSGVGELSSCTGLGLCRSVHPYVEPAFFIGIGLLAVGIFLMWESIKILGIRTDNKPGVSAGLHR